MISTIKISPFIVFILFYCMLASAYASVTFGYSFYVEFVLAIICYFYFSKRKVIKGDNYTHIASVLFIIAAVYTTRGANLAGYLSKIMTVSLAVLMMNLREDWRVELFKIISRWFAILLAISVVFWLLHYIIPLPHSTAESESVWGYYETVKNYFFFKETSIASSMDTIQRFQSLFLEPGHLGTIVTFFLIANRFNFKDKQNIVFLICVLLSLSASAYILTALGYLFSRSLEKGGKGFIIAIILIIGAIIFAMQYNEGDNIVSNLILGKITREEGALEGRVSLEILSIFNQMWSTGENLWLGKGIFSDVEVLGAGFILFFVLHGIIGTFLIVLSYFGILRSCYSRMGLVLYLVFIVSFLQRTYPFWDAFSLTFILGLPYLKNEESKKTNRILCTQ